MDRAALDEDGTRDYVVHDAVVHTSANAASPVAITSVGKAS